ncbi:tRNA (guanosine(37)-N1)-methyltransferase TrmD [Patescibacteria group bacterium]|nr:tRNA (guanosine(37)-N1)-methyltransferase TrmD [Patescibacteria group bacterium]MCL5091282.1 tRNA (guanosine(37)-N1)-methyltransferase TrmD [Patescibacteria group bacterium]
MKITVLTLFPAMVEAFFQESIVKRAQQQGRVEISVVNLRDFALDHYGSVDDRPYGGGAGMVLRVDVLDRALQRLRSSGAPGKSKIVLTSAKGERFSQAKAAALAKLNELIIVAGHYEGVDERVRSLVDEELSLGDFVMTGGEISAAAIVDALVRLLPGVLKKHQAVREESFSRVSLDGLIDAVGADPILKRLKQAGKKTVLLLEYPHYTRPVSYNGKVVPAVLRSGDPRKISAWRLQQSFKLTKRRRIDLLQ